MNAFPENKFGYIKLTYSPDKDNVLIKANQIKLIHEGSDEFPNAVISFGSYKSEIHVNESVETILEQLENIHPSLR